MENGLFKQLIEAAKQAVFISKGKAMREINQAGLDIIKKWEKGPKGASPALKAYQDTGGVWTIGWGHTNGVHPGMTCTVEQAEKWLNDDLDNAEHGVNSYVKVPINENQFSALVSFTFNVGVAALGHSTLLDLLNDGFYNRAAAQFDRWIYDNGKPLDGLRSRRNDEEALFMKAI